MAASPSSAGGVGFGVTSVAWSFDRSRGAGGLSAGTGDGGYGRMPRRACEIANSFPERWFSPRHYGPRLPRRPVNANQTPSRCGVPGFRAETYERGRHEQPGGQFHVARFYRQLAPHFRNFQAFFAAGGGGHLRPVCGRPAPRLIRGEFRRIRQAGRRQGHRLLAGNFDGV